MNYYQVIIYLRSNNKPVKGIREFYSNDMDEVTKTVRKKAERHYKDDILRIDVWPVAAWNDELKQYLDKNKKEE